MTVIKVLHVVGARPNYMKIAPIMEAMGREGDYFHQMLVHTGQHYDHNMSQIFFDELGMPRPDYNLEVGSGSHAVQTAQVMLSFEPLVKKFRPDWVIVAGDVNSTLACTLVCSKLEIRVAHVEAGLRSFDRTMPEEINRILTDRVADLLLTPSRDADENLRREGVKQERIHFVGNVMIDTLVRLMPKASLRWSVFRERLSSGKFVLVSLHRPSNVDDGNTLRGILEALNIIARDIQVVFPVHPRTRQRMHDCGLLVDQNGLLLLEPLGYLDFLALQMNASLVVTDSGGVQEETTYLGVPCLTARPNTERPITITHGTNTLVASNKEAILSAVSAKLGSPMRNSSPPEYWDGHAAERIVRVLQQIG